MRTPSRNAPAPRTAVTHTPVAWLTTRPASAPSASSAQIDVAQYGNPPRTVRRTVDGIEHDRDRRRRALVHPRLLAHDPHAGALQHARTPPASATRSSAYWPARSVRSRSAAGSMRVDGIAGPRRRRRRTARATHRVIRGRRHRDGHHFDDRVVVGNARDRVAPGRREQRVRLREERLHVAGPDRREVHAGAHLAVRRTHEHRLALAHAERGRVGRREEQRVAVRAGERIDVVPHHRVELLARAGSRARSARRARRGVRARRRRTFARPSGVGNTPPSHSRSPPIWIASPVARSFSIPAYAGTTRAISARIASADSHPNTRGLLGPHPARDVGEDPPFAARLADARPRDLGTERDAALGRGRRAAALLLVARRRGQQHDDLARDRRASGGVSTMSWWMRSAARASAVRVTSGAGSTSRKLPPLDHSTSRSPWRAASTIAAAVSPGVAGTAKPHCAPSSAAARRGDRPAAGERRGVAAHLRAALHARVAADRHEPRARAPDVAARQAEVHDRAHVVDAGDVLGHAHRPHEHRRAAPPRTSARSAPCRRGSRPTPARAASNDSSSSSLKQRVEPGRVLVDEPAVDRRRSPAAPSARR